MQETQFSSKDIFFFLSEFYGDTEFSQSVFIGETNFNKSRFEGKADLSKVKFHNNPSFKGVVFKPGADFSHSKMVGISLSEASAKKAKFQSVDLSEADLFEANLYESDFSNATLFRVNLKEANIGKCEFWEVKEFPTIYEPEAGNPPYIPSVANLSHLSSMTFKDSPHGLVDLREGFKELGYREQERKVTYAIKFRERQNLWNTKGGNSNEVLTLLTLFRRAESVFYYILFELTSDYGLKPGRPLLILLGFIFIFTIPYTEFIQREGNDGIWKIWINDRVRQDLGSQEPVRIYRLGYSAMRTAFYFSLLSAFSIGWKDLNVGNWIARIQKREYVLKATGSARVISGIQSLLSVYLLALWVLTYFGRPFDNI